MAEGERKKGGEGCQSSGTGICQMVGWGNGWFFQFYCHEKRESGFIVNKYCKPGVGGYNGGGDL